MIFTDLDSALHSWILLSLPEGEEASGVDFDEGRNPQKLLCHIGAFNGSPGSEQPIAQSQGSALRIYPRCRYLCVGLLEFGLANMPLSQQSFLAMLLQFLHGLSSLFSFYRSPKSSQPQNPSSKRPPTDPKIRSVRVHLESSVSLKHLASSLQGTL